MKKSLLLGLSIALLMPLGIAAGLPDLGESAQSDLSPQAERAIGQSVMNDIRLHETSYLDDPEVTGYINELGHRLTAQSDDTLQGFEFFALRDSTLNAFAMPGGFIGVHTGLMIATESESELASVLAHEVSHVTQHHLARQLRPQAQSQMLTLMTFAVAVLASRNRPDLAQGAMMAGQGAAIQNQLSYSRDFEREADRFGLALMEKAGYDVRGMASFFGRLEKYTRIYESNDAPSYLRTHPLTTERITDIENRIQQRPYRQVPDSLAFTLVRAKLAVIDGTPQDAAATFKAQIAGHKFNSEIAAHYGLALALSKTRNYSGAEAELRLARQTKATSPMFETLAADLRLKQGDAASALSILRSANSNYPQNRAVAYMLVETLIQSGNLPEALQVTTRDLQSYTTDSKMYEFQARTYAGLGKQLLQHRVLAEAYYNRGQNVAAIEQLSLAQKAPDGDFYDHSQVDSRLRELRAIEAAKPKQEQNQNQPLRWSLKDDHHEL